MNDLQLFQIGPAWFWVILGGVVLILGLYALVVLILALFTVRSRRLDFPPSDTVPLAESPPEPKAHESGLHAVSREPGQQT